MTDHWVCPNVPRCPHPGLLHDIWDYDDPRPTCCIDGCSCGEPEPAVDGELPGMWEVADLIGGATDAEEAPARRAHPDTTGETENQ